jgi:DNA-binding NarL/FixJ family response regulator
MRRVSPWFLLSVLLLPVQLGASSQDAYTHLAALLAKSTASPVEFSATVDAKSTDPKVKQSFQLQVNGAVEPKQTAGSYASSNVTLTVQVHAAQDSDMYGGTLNLLLLKKVLYGRLSALTIPAKNSSDGLTAFRKAFENVWVSFPTSPSQEQQVTKTVRSGPTNELLKSITVKETKTSNGTVFTFGLSPQGMRSMMRQFPKLKRPKISASGSALFDAAGAFQSFTFRMDATGSAAAGTISLPPGSTKSPTSAKITVTLMVQKLRQPLSLQVPTSATPIGDVWNAMTKIPAPVTRDAQRRSDVNTILNALYQYAIDHNGNFPVSFTNEEQSICVPHASPCDGVDLKALLDTYLIAIPSDPLQSKGAVTTGYTVKRVSESGDSSHPFRIQVSAPKAESTAEISVSR